MRCSARTAGWAIGLLLLAIGAPTPAPGQPAPAQVAPGQPGPRQPTPAPPLRRDWPCPGCLFLPPPPAAATPAPLLVVLHGDAPAGRSPDVRGPIEALAAAAAARGVALFAPRCPPEHGCDRGSFWQWTRGDARGWLLSQVRALQGAYPLTTERRWLVGWSGGASFAGSRVPELGPDFAAIAFIGGGMPPAPPEPEAPAACPCLPPAYFLVGDANPFHYLARRLRDLYTTCQTEARWQLLPGAGHAGEWAALRSPSRAAEILDWLSLHPQRCPAGPGP